MCKYCKQGNVAVVFSEVRSDGASVFIDNRPDSSILAVGYVIPRREGRTETDICNYHTIHYCPWCGRKLN